MKVRFGVGLGAATSPRQFSDLLPRIEAAGIDSVWLSEQIYSDAVDPFIGLAHALARTTRLKVGTSVAVLPGRHPVLVAKQLVALAELSPRRVLPVFGLRPARPSELALFPVPAGQRAAVFDESLAVIRLLLSGESVTFAGEFFTIEDGRIGPVPARPLDLWLGGSAPAGLRRVGRYADGWLGSFLTPDEAGRAVVAINAAAAEAGRAIEPDHFGISLTVTEGDIPESLVESVQRRLPGRDPAEFVATSWAILHDRLDGYLEAGLTKFVIRSVGSSSDDFLDRFASELLPRQN